VHGFIRKDIKKTNLPITPDCVLPFSGYDNNFRFWFPYFCWCVCVCWHGCFIWTSFARVLCVFAPWLRGPFGRCNIDLSKFEREKTHRFWQELEDGAGSLHLLLTISGTTSSETISDLSSYEENPREKANIEARYVSDAAGYFHNNCKKKNILSSSFGGKITIMLCQKTFSIHKKIRQDGEIILLGEELFTV
jgi:hypothetical protein